MKKRIYQYHYLRISKDTCDFRERKKKALKILAILDHFFNSKLPGEAANLICLEIGCSLGGMTKIFASHFKRVIGIDIDEEAITEARKKILLKNATFKVGDALNLSFKNDSFNIVMCNNVYEHVPDPSKMMHEIHRVLKKSGICYFAGPNKYTLIESDHNLPFLSWFPKSFGHLYLKILGKGDYYYENTLSQRELRKLVTLFKCYDYTIEVLKKPQRFQATHKWQRVISSLPTSFLKAFLPFMPSFFWILVKIEGKN